MANSQGIHAALLVDQRCPVAVKWSWVGAVTFIGTRFLSVLVCWLTAGLYFNIFDILFIFAQNLERLQEQIGNLAYLFFFFLGKMRDDSPNLLRRYGKYI